MALFVVVENEEQGFVQENGALNKIPLDRIQATGYNKDNTKCQKQEETSCTVIFSIK